MNVCLLQILNLHNNDVGFSPQVLQSSPELYNPDHKTPQLVQRNLHKMLSTPRTSSRELPVGFSKLEKKLSKAGTKFIQQFDIKEPRMRQIVKELRRISEELEKMQEKTDNNRRVGSVVGGVGLAAGVVVGFFAAPFTGGMSLVAAAVGGGVGAVPGLGVVGAANVNKMSTETDSVQAVKRLGKEFQEVIEPLKGTLKEIQETCEKLEKKAAEDQSGNTLTNMEEFENILGRVSEELLIGWSEENLRHFSKDILKQLPGLKEQSAEVVCVVKSLVWVIEKLLILIGKVFTLFASPEQDKQLRHAIIQSADQSQKVVDECEKMKNILKGILKQCPNSRRRV